MATNDKYTKIIKEVFKGNNGTQFRIINDRLSKLEEKIELLLKHNKIKTDFKDSDLKSEVKDIENKINNIIKPVIYKNNPKLKPVKKILKTNKKVKKKVKKPLM